MINTPGAAPLRSLLPERARLRAHCVLFECGPSPGSHGAAEQVGQFKKEIKPKFESSAVRSIFRLQLLQLLKTEDNHAPEEISSVKMPF